jgi:hydroxymethylbilane synthase
MLSKLNHAETSLRVHAERAMNATLLGGCQVPIGSFAEFSDNTLSMRALVAQPDGSAILKASASRNCKIDDITTAQVLGEALADDLIAQGARDILDAL